MRSSFSLCLALALTACSSRPERPPPAAPPPVVSSSSPVSSASLPTAPPPAASSPPPAPAASSSSPSAAPPVDPDAPFGPPGPIKIVGYPVLVGSGYAAVALAAGFTSDGESLGVCFSDGGREGATCRWQNRAGKEREAYVATVAGTPERIRPASAMRGLQRLRYVGPAAWDLRAPPLVGSWPFARDIVLHVIEVQGKAKGVAAPRLRLGGSVGGRKPVFPIEVKRPPSGGIPMDVHFIRPNAVALSPDGRELGLVVHSAVGEYDSTYTFHRSGVRALAARIYALTAAEARRAGEADVSNALCALAVSADADAARELCAR